MPDNDGSSFWHFAPLGRRRSSLILPVKSHVTKGEPWLSVRGSKPKLQKVKRSFSEIRQRPPLFDYWTKKYSETGSLQNCSSVYDASVKEKLFTTLQNRKVKNSINSGYQDQPYRVNANRKCCCGNGKNQAGYSFGQSLHRSVMLREETEGDAFNEQLCRKRSSDIDRRNFSSALFLKPQDSAKNSFNESADYRSRKTFGVHGHQNSPLTSSNKKEDFSQFSCQTSCLCKEISPYRGRPLLTQDFKISDNGHYLNVNRIHSGQKNDIKSSLEDRSSIPCSFLPSSSSIETECKNHFEKSESTHQKLLVASCGKGWPMMFEEDCNIRIPRVQLADFQNHVTGRNRHTKETESSPFFSQDGYDSVNVHKLHSQMLKCEEKVEMRKTTNEEEDKEQDMNIVPTMSLGAVNPNCYSESLKEGTATESSTAFFNNKNTILSCRKEKNATAYFQELYKMSSNDQSKRSALLREHKSDKERKLRISERYNLPPGLSVVKPENRVQQEFELDKNATTKQENGTRLLKETFHKTQSDSRLENKLLKHKNINPTCNQYPVDTVVPCNARKQRKNTRYAQDDILIMNIRSKRLRNLPLRRVHSLYDKKENAANHHANTLVNASNFNDGYILNTDKNRDLVSETHSYTMSGDDVRQTKFSLINNVEYGPGIVRKLRDRFTQLSKEGSSKARISRQTTRKRFPSVDDILSPHSSDCRETANFINHRSNGTVSDEQWRTLSTVTKQQTNKGFTIGHSESDSKFCPEKPTVRAVFPGTSVDSKQRDQMLQTVQTEIPVRALKERFEHTSRSKNGSAFRRIPRSHSATPRGSDGLNRWYSDENEEPELTHFHRVLKTFSRNECDQNSNHLVTYSNPEAKKPLNVDKSMEITLPTLSNSARIIPFSTMEPEEKTSFSLRPISILDLVSPPDPDSARVPLMDENSQSDYTFTTLHVNYECDRSPPPEEPKPPSCCDISCLTKTSTAQKSLGLMTNSRNAKTLDIFSAIPTKRLIPQNDGSGIQEMQQLLYKFSSIREQKNLSDNVVEYGSEPSVPSTERPEHEKFLTQPAAKAKAAERKDVTENKSCKLLLTQKSSLVAVPKPPDFVPTSNHLLKEDSSVKTQTSTTLESSYRMPSKIINTASSNKSGNPHFSTRQSVVSITINDPSPKTEVSGATDKETTHSEPVAENSSAVSLLATETQDSAVSQSQQSEIVEKNSTSLISHIPVPSAAEKQISQETQRKSLSSKFFESKSQTSPPSEAENAFTKQQLDNITRRPKPYGDDATEIAEKSPDFVCAVSSSDDEADELHSEVADKKPNFSERGGNVATILEKFSRQQVMDEDGSYQERPTSFSPYMAFTAGDGNPVRHSLINLVMEEDVPLLMEAMAEKLEFEFEDLAAIPSSSSEGIIRNGLLNQRKKQRNVSRIGFSDSPPAVFSYPDETTATEFSEWHPGEDITFEEYQKICEEERRKYEEERLEANKWHASLIANNATEMNSILSVTEQPTVGDFALGVTSRISYGRSPPYNSNSNYGTANISLIAGK